MESTKLGACLFLMALAVVRCGGNSNLVGFFADGGPSGGAGSAGATVTTNAAGSGGTRNATGSGGMTSAGGSVVTGGGGTGGTVSLLFGCRSPTEVTNPPSGYIACSNGMVHRPEKRQCPETLPRTGFNIDAGADCHRDADCTAKPHGHCEWWSNLAGSGTVCEYGCINDAECGAGQICLCGAVTGTCTGTTNCTEDADCGVGLMCVGYYEACEQTRFSCQSLNDTCGGFLDCQSSPSCPMCNVCTNDGTTAGCASRCVASE